MSAATINTCAACGKEGDCLKSCGACKLVKYCSRECQANHRPMHKKECKKRAAELYDEKLFKEVELDECPLCFLILPSADLTTIKSCCGKTICNGCVYAMKMSEGGANVCAFCRTPPPSSDEDEIKRVKSLMDKGNAEACFLLAGYYVNGSRGLTRDYQKANELHLKAGELGCAGAYFNLGDSFFKGKGLEVDKKKAKHYWELAAMGGYVPARYNLGIEELETRKIERAFKHFILAARAGSERALESVKIGFMKGLVTKEQYASALRAYQKIHDGMKSDARDKAAASR